MKSDWNQKRSKTVLKNQASPSSTVEENTKIRAFEEPTPAALRMSSLKSESINRVKDLNSQLDQFCSRISPRADENHDQ